MIQFDHPAACAAAVKHGDAESRWWWGEATRQERAAAQEICHTCPNEIPCRDWARQNYEFGLWGGETERQRTLAGWRPRHRAADPFAGLAKPVEHGSAACYDTGCRETACVTAKKSRRRTIARQNAQRRNNVDVRIARARNILRGPE